jgi:hypothetical protein
MEPLNIVEIETRWGYRSFELYNADITQLDFNVDLLAFSAATYSLHPVAGTVIAALEENCGVSAAELAADPPFNFRRSLGCWVSESVQNSQFDRLLCAEVIGGDLDVAEVLENLFVAVSILELKHVPSRSLALPVLGAGRLGLDPEAVIDCLLESSIRFLKRSEHLERIIFVEMDEKRAMQLDAAMNKSLGRVKLVLPKGELIANIRSEILKTVDRAERDALLPDSRLLSEVRRIVASENSRSFELGILGRKVTEVVVDDIVKESGSIDLYKKIEQTAQLGIAPWVCSYLHVLRVFGNESAHERDRGSRTPVAIDESDLALCFFCLSQTLSFYLGWREGQKAAAESVS